MTTLFHTITLDDLDLNDLTNILEKSLHPNARYLLDRLWRTQDVGFSSRNNLEFMHEKTCGK